MTQKSKKILFLSSLICAFLGFAIGIIAMYAAWEQNPQCEIHCDGNIHWAYWLGIGISWFFIVELVGLIILGIIPACIIEAVTRRNAKKTNQNIKSLSNITKEKK